MIYLLIFLNSLKFIGLDYAPPGFYVDEMAGAVQAICLSETGRDFYGDLLPLFAPGVNDAFYTPVYLYGQAAWTTLFGNSIFAFRAFIAFVSVITIGFLYAWVKQISSQRIAFYVALSATVMPWSFHFSRIAWDPPLGVCFLVMGLWAAYRLHRPLLIALLLSLAAYSYSPLRIAIPIIWLLLPGIQVKTKLWVIFWSALLAIPLLLQMQIPEFMARSELRALWSPYSTNQFRNLDVIDLTGVGLQQFLTHFSPSFLFMSGDQNLRHSIGTFGELSYLDLLTYLASLGTLIYLLIWHRKRAHFEDSEKTLLTIALLGIIANVLPAALTNEGAPHALRAIGAWPFYAILTGVLCVFLERHFPKKILGALVIMIAVIFFAIYQFSFYTQYPNTVKDYFLTDDSKINLAYGLMTKQGLSCKAVPKEPKPKLSNELVKIQLKRPIVFSNLGYGALYLGGSWHDQEPWGIWSKPDGALLRFLTVPPNAKSLSLTLKVIVSPSHPQQILLVRVNDGPEQSYTLKDPTQNTIEIALTPQDLMRTHGLEIYLTTPGAVNPIDAGVSREDNRTLGAGLISAVFH